MAAGACCGSFGPILDCGSCAKCDCCGGGDCWCVVVVVVGGAWYRVGGVDCCSEIIEVVVAMTSGLIASLACRRLWVNTGVSGAPAGVTV